jgi:uracil-DNA glycosylase family 4
MATARRQLDLLNARIVTCERCPRLRAHCTAVAREKRRAWRDWDYWGRPVPGFGDPGAELLIVGLAPAAHGANRTGRMFTGDRSGEFLYALLHRAGFASQAASRHRADGLCLRGAYITAVARCAPPQNQPAPEEIARCREYLQRELDVLRPRAVLALGRIAFDGVLACWRERGLLQERSAFRFAHGAAYDLPSLAPDAAVARSARRRPPGGRSTPGPRRGPRLFAAYHPSQQNTQTGRLTDAMFLCVLRSIRRYLVHTGVVKGLKSVSRAMVASVASEPINL